MILNLLSTIWLDFINYYYEHWTKVILYIFNLTTSKKNIYFEKLLESSFIKCIAFLMFI